MNLDSYEVNVGDTVHDFIFGAGTIASVSAREVTVLFSDGAQRAYNAVGVTPAIRVRTLFWGDPLLSRMPPVKDPARRTHLAIATAHLEAIINSAYTL